MTSSVWFASLRGPEVPDVADVGVGSAGTPAIDSGRERVSIFSASLKTSEVNVSDSWAASVLSGRIACSRAVITVSATVSLIGVSPRQ